ncbi:MAG: magnesium/cobalt transporter CorA [Thermoanaerobaculia bacterium]
MIRVLLFYADGTIRTGGAELLGEACQPEIGGWIDFDGDREAAEKLLREQSFHPLAIEDTFTLHHQPRIEEYDDHVFVIVRGIDFNDDDPAAHLDTLKLAAFLRRNLLVTVHRNSLRSVKAVWQRVTESGKALPGGVVQALWGICDEIIDLYQPIVDAIGHEIEDLEGEVLDATGRVQLEKILSLRRRLSVLRRIMLPHRAVFSHLANSRQELFDATASLNFRDTLDNVLRLTDAIDQQRDQLANVKDTYLSVVSQRTNEIMKVLTLFSAVMLPLTFIAGVYGMNFEHMPELGSRFGYPAVLTVMGGIAGGMILWFRRRGWF